MISSNKFPKELISLENKSIELGFDMPSDRKVGMLLRTLVASKPNGKFLELGTGMGLSLSWMIDGMDEKSSIDSIDNDSKLVEIVKSKFLNLPKVNIILEEGENWINASEKSSYDLIFADTWPGKFWLLDETLDLLKVGGFYVIDDLNRQSNWPEGHELRVKDLISKLSDREGFYLTVLDWSTGVMILTKWK